MTLLYYSVYFHNKFRYFIHQKYENICNHCLLKFDFSICICHVLKSFIPFLIEMGDTCVNWFVSLIFEKFLITFILKSNKVVPSHPYVDTYATFITQYIKSYQRRNKNYKNHKVK